MNTHRCKNNSKTGLIGMLFAFLSSMFLFQNSLADFGDVEINTAGGEPSLEFESGRTVGDMFPGWSALSPSDPGFTFAETPEGNLSFSSPTFTGPTQGGDLVLSELRTVEGPDLDLSVAVSLSDEPLTLGNVRVSAGFLSDANDSVAVLAGRIEDDSTGTLMAGSVLAVLVGLGGAQFQCFEILDSGGGMFSVDLIGRDFQLNLASSEFSVVGQITVPELGLDASCTVNLGTSLPAAQYFPAVDVGAGVLDELEPVDALVSVISGELGPVTSQVSADGYYLRDGGLFAETNASPGEIFYESVLLLVGDNLFTVIDGVTRLPLDGTSPLNLVLLRVFDEISGEQAATTLYTDLSESEFLAFVTENSLPPGSNIDGFLSNIFLPPQIPNGSYQFNPPSLSVEIDIKPGGYPNSVNPNAGGFLPVAILTTSVAEGDAADFDAVTVDPDSLAFGPAGVQIARAAKEKDVDSDGDVDLILHFKISETGIACGDTEAMLTGQTFGGDVIEGADSLVTKCRN